MLPFPPPPAPTSSANSGPQVTSKVQQDMLRALKQLVTRKEHQVETKKRLNEWRMVAIAVDRILFWIFFVITTISSLVFLVILPVMKRAEFVRST